MTGVTGSVGAPVPIYFQALGLDKEEFLQALSLSFFLTAMAWIPSVIIEAAFGLEIGLTSTAALIPAFAGCGSGVVSVTICRNFILAGACSCF